MLADRSRVATLSCSYKPVASPCESRQDAQDDTGRKRYKQNNCVDEAAERCGIGASATFICSGGNQDT